MKGMKGCSRWSAASKTRVRLTQAARESEVGNRESGVGSRESGVGSRESEAGSKKLALFPTPSSLFPIADSPLPSAVAVISGFTHSKYQSQNSCQKK